MLSRRYRHLIRISTLTLIFVSSFRIFSRISSNALSRHRALPFSEKKKLGHGSLVFLINITPPYSILETFRCCVRDCDRLAYQKKKMSFGCFRKLYKLHFHWN